MLNGPSFAMVMQDPRCQRISRIKVSHLEQVAPEIAAESKGPAAPRRSHLRLGALFSPGEPLRNIGTETRPAIISEEKHFSLKTSGEPWFALFIAKYCKKSNIKAK